MPFNRQKEKQQSSQKEQENQPNTLNLFTSKFFISQTSQFSKLLPSKYSDRTNGIVQAFAANTHQGTIRNYNEDRVSVVLNILKPDRKRNCKAWPQIQYFGIYDGHGGSKCAEFLRDNLHYYIINNDQFPQDIETAIKNGCQQAEQDYLKLVQDNYNNAHSVELDKSGACAISLLIVDNEIYVINVGDSRCFLSKNYGENVVWLSQDHRPSLESEKQRILAAGGQIYQNLALANQIFTQLKKLQKGQSLSDTDKRASSRQFNYTEKVQSLVPLRILPGRLNVARTFGDIESKVPIFGGKPGVIISNPEILHFTLSQQCDFIFLGCDGIFDKTSTQELNRLLWESLIKYLAISNKFNNNNNNNNQHCIAGKMMEDVIEDALRKRAFDNITGIIIILKDMKVLAKEISLLQSKDQRKWEQSEEVLFGGSQEALQLSKGELLESCSKNK